jgi:hypothetical protein
MFRGLGKSDDFDSDFGRSGYDFLFVGGVAPAASSSVAASPSPPSSAPVATTRAVAVSAAADLAAHETSGWLYFAGARALLRDALTQPMTPTLFADLQAVAVSLNTAAGPSASRYVQQMFDNVVLGDTANAHWHGGAANATGLGDLSANSTTGNLRGLVGKWILGNDLPGDADAPGQGSADVAYKTYNLPLFTGAGPAITDVNQGQIGDCWFLAALGETAMQDPSLISSMIVAHGATYGIEFWVDGKPDFVTVNSALPTYNNGAEQCDGSAMTGANSTTSLWVPLVEKALAQLSEQTGVVTGMEYAGGDNQYYELNSGGGEGITLITGQQTAAYGLGGLTSGGLSSLLGQMASALRSGQDVLLGTSDQAVSGDLVADHMFAVTGVDAAAGLVSLYNPWGANAAGNGKSESFTIAASALEADNAYFYAALGVPKAA